MPRSSGAVSTLGKKLLVLIAVKSSSTPGTAVPGYSALTADIHSPTPATHPSKDEHSRLERLALPSYSTQIRYSASTRLLSSSRRFTIPSTTTIREVEAAFESGFHLIWSHLQEDGDSPTQIDETDQKCSGFKRQTPPRDGVSRGGDGALVGPGGKKHQAIQ